MRIPPSGLYHLSRVALQCASLTDHLTQTKLGTIAGLAACDVTHTVRALEDRRLIARTKDPSHGRRQLV